MTRLRHALIIAALLSATPSCALAAEQLDGIFAAESGAPSAQAGPPGRESQSQPVDAGTTQGNAAGAGPGRRIAVLASHAEPSKRLEFGIGIRHDTLAPDFNGWYGVYLQGFDRVAERNTLYGQLRENPRFGLEDGRTPRAVCCRTSAAQTSLEQFASHINAREASPTYLFFGLLKKKQWGLDIDDEWKVKAGVRTLQYSSTARTRVGYLNVERYWETVRATYSYQIERAGGANLALSHVVQLDYLFNPHDSIGFSVTSGREFANFGTLGVLNTEVRSAAIHGQHWLKRAWALTFQAGYNHHGDMPSQNGIRFGLRHSF